MPCSSLQTIQQNEGYSAKNFSCSSKIGINQYFKGTNCNYPLEVQTKRKTEQQLLRQNGDVQLKFVLGGWRGFFIAIGYMALPRVAHPEQNIRKILGRARSGEDAVLPQQLLFRFMFGL